MAAIASRSATFRSVTVVFHLRREPELARRAGSRARVVAGDAGGSRRATRAKVPSRLTFRETREADVGEAREDRRA